MDDIGKIVYESIRISAPEFIRLAFAGMAGGLLGAYINDRLTRKRENESGVSTRRRDFLTFMHSWRKAAEGIVSRYDAIDHFPGWFIENIPGFCGFAETIRADFTDERRNKFEGFTSTISDSNWKNKCNPDEYKKWLKIVDELIVFVDSYKI